MNTKFFLLLLVSLFISTSTSSLVANKFEAAVSTEGQIAANKDNQPESPIDVPPSKWTPDGPKVHHDNKAPLQPEDGKHHHFHFSRIACPKKRRQINCLIYKIILTIAHICCFIYCFLHVFH